jgi:hypothetical protein
MNDIATSYDIDKIKDIKNRIETMNKHHQIEVLRILKSANDVVFNENVNGVFVNLSEVSQEILNKLETYIFYVDKQTINIEHIETQKEIIENTFFKNKGNKENSNIKVSVVETSI